MISPNQYVPILKCKAGEFMALAKLSPDVRDELIPIFDIVPPGGKKFVDHIEDSLKYLRRWDKTKLFYIDGYMVQDIIYSPRIHAMEYLFRVLSREGFKVLPVINSVTNREYNSAVKQIITNNNSGLCLRIFRNPIEKMNNDIDQFLNFLELTPSSIDLVIDMRELYSLNTEAINRQTINILQNISYLNNWRSLVLTGGSFPIDLVELKADQIHPLERVEWMNWKQLITNNEIDRIPAYSDYGISHPLISETGIGIPNASASIRYTCENEFSVYRGRGTRQKGFKQFNVLSETLINSNEYYGAGHCEGDKYINTNGTIKLKPGSLTTWRWVGTCHHLTVVSNQLRQFFRNLSAERTS